MGPFFRLIFLASLAWVGVVLFREEQMQAHLASPDSSRVVMLFGGVVVVGIIGAVLIAQMVVPAIGDLVAGFVAGPGKGFEHTRHSDAAALLARGDAEGAISVYEEIVAKDPADAFAVSEIARICCRELDDPARGAAVIEEALRREWALEKASFLAHRLADVYLLQDDAGRAREVLLDVVRTMAGTKYAAQAQRRVREMVEDGGAKGRLRG